MILDFFPYCEKEMTYLKKKDKRMGAAIERLGKLEREISPEPFSALVESIIAQQISSKAADTVCRRVRDLLGEINPANILNADAVALQKCGMSQRKTEYIINIARAGAEEINFSELHKLSNAEIMQKLTALKGVGEWTVEMLLIFSLCRPDILSYKDLAIRRGMMNLYGLKELSPEQFEKYRKRYSPYGSVASLYLWELS